MAIEKVSVQISIALAIVALCVLAALYILDLIKLPFLDNVTLKIIVTAIICIGFALYIFLIFKNRVQRLHMIGFSILFEAIGYWWLNSWIGYMFVVIGFGLLIFSFFQH